MPYFVQASGLTDASDAADALQEVFVRVATEAIGLLEPMETLRTFDQLRERIGRRDVEIGGWTHPTGKVIVAGGWWDRGEIETNLRHIEVIALALRSVVLRCAKSVNLNPTQQSGFDASGEVDGKPWVLEAYGGVSVENNNKLVDAAKALRETPGDARRFFACRPTAWPWKRGTKRLGEDTFTLANDPRQESVMLWEFATAL